MTTPTQAQIEAAAKAIYDLPVNWRANKPIWEQASYQYINEAKAALTAAAQVGEPKTEQAEGQTMTTPTQAQIEAAAKAICNTACQAEDCWPDEAEMAEEREHWMGLANAALTAAAQVEEQVPSAFLPPEQFKLAERLTNEELLIQTTINVKNDTIERCAQVAEEYELYGSTRHAQIIAAAIRKLKDE